MIQPTGDVRWCQLVAAASLGAGGKPVRISGVTTDITFRKEAEARQTLLAREVDHRAKNALAVVQAIVRLAKRDTIDDYVSAVEGRVSALAQTHELLSRTRWEGADMLQLILEEIAPYNDELQRVVAVGPAVLLTPEDAQTIAMALHELATNAAKYGALSVQSGRVDISWSHFEDRLRLTWSESAGPPVQAPSRTGFGTRIILSSFKGGNRGSAEFNWRGEGLQCTLELGCKVTPLSTQTARCLPGALPEQPEPAVHSASTSKARLLLVEDEAVVGMFMEELLGDLGFEPTGPIASLKEALAAAKRERFDGAVLDMNLKGELVYPLAELLRTQNVPFIFVTGYSKMGVDDRFSGVPIVQKPVTSEALAEVLFSKFGRFVLTPPADRPAVAARAT